MVKHAEQNVTQIIIRNIFPCEGCESWQRVGDTIDVFTGNQREL